MRREQGVFRAIGWLGMGCLAAISLSTASGATFQFGTLIQAGFNGNGGGGNWEIAVGNTAGATADTDSIQPNWFNNADRSVVLEYLKPTNTLNVRVYDGAVASGPFDQASYNPTGGAAVAANAMWTLPAASFFVTATTGPTQNTSITFTNLTLSGVSGPINVIQPFQQTTLVASRAPGGPTSSVAQSQDIVFQADATGSWRLQGTIRFTGVNGGAGNADGSELALRVTALANDAVPEPGTLGLLSLGGAAMIGFSRRRRAAGKGTA